MLREGVLVRQYGYDFNGNRTHLNGALVGSYDDQDRIQTYQTRSYRFGPNGDLQRITDGARVTDLAYDVFGNLKRVVLPGATTIEYVVDGRHRRVGKKVNGTLVQGFVYADQLRIAAELDGAGSVVSRFVYGTKRNVPEYMVKGSEQFRLLTDQVGSVRLVVNAQTGAIAQRIDYDEFGQVTLDSSPGFQPFGFAGGLYDHHSGLVRFGARDYDASIGRWTAKDPVLFRGGDTNLYAYVRGDPASLVDHNGLEPGNLYQRGYALPIPRFDQEPGLVPVCVECALLPLPRLIKWVIDACPDLKDKAPKFPPRKPREQIDKEFRDKLNASDEVSDTWNRNQERIDAIADALRDSGYSNDQISEMMKGLQGGPGFGYPPR